MKRLVLLAVLLLAAYGAEATTYWNPDWGCSADGSGCEGYEGFESEGGGGTGTSNNDEYTLGHDYATCEAWSIWKQKCYGCQWNRYNKLVCATVDASAGCMCQQVRSNPAVAGITECRRTGACTYE